MIARGELERVPASREHAELLLAQARQHLDSAQTIAEPDPAGAYQLLYDAARKALAAVLENEGLRATSRGGHIVVREAVSAQLDPPLGGILRPFDRLRRRRNQAEYPWSLITRSFACNLHAYHVQCMYGRHAADQERA
jgi:hypothetical protein